MWQVSMRNMKIGKLTGFAGLAIACLLPMLAAISCGNGDGGKIPITTKSEKARELYIKARDLAENLRINDAIDVYERAIDEDGNFALAHLGLSFALFNNNATRGFEVFNRAVALAGNVSEGERLWIKGTEAGVNGNPREQEAMFKKLVKLHHSDERAHNIMGGFYYQQQRYDLAVTEFRKAKEINPEFAPLYNMLGYSYRFLGKYKAAEEAFKTYIKLIPDNPNPYDSYAELLMKIGEFEESIEMYRRALHVDSTFGASRFGIASDLVFLSEHAEARKVLEDWIARSDDDGDHRLALLGITMSYVEEGRLQEAIETSRRQLQIARDTENNVGMGNDLAQIGSIYLEMGRVDDAAESYRVSLDAYEEAEGVGEAVKENARTGYLYFKARVDIARGDLDRAREAAELYRERTRENQNPAQERIYHELLGTIALSEGEFEVAAKELEQANRQDPYNLYRSMLAYEGMGDEERAQELCEQVANFNQLLTLNFAFVRQKARQRLATI